MAMVISYRGTIWKAKNKVLELERLLPKGVLDIMVNDFMDVYKAQHPTLETVSSNSGPHAEFNKACSDRGIYATEKQFKESLKRVGKD
jgi:hypothetical protein